MITVTRAGGVVPAGSITDSELASPNNAVYKTVYTGASYTAAAQTVGTYVVVPTGQMLVSAANITALGQFRFDPVNYAVAGLTTKLRVFGTLMVNNVAPGASTTFRAGLYPAPNSNNALVAITVGTVVTGSQHTLVTAPAAGSTTTLDSGDFDVPTAGPFALAVVHGGATIAANSFVTFSLSVLIRNT